MTDNYVVIMTIKGDEMDDRVKHLFLEAESVTDAIYRTKQLQDKLWSHQRVKVTDVYRAHEYPATGYRLWDVTPPASPSEDEIGE